MTTARATRACRWIAIAVLGCSALVSTQADAQRRHGRDRGGADSSERRAQELFHRGDALYAQGRYEDAILAFQEAYAISERPLLLYNIANAEERLGRWADALGMLQRYLPDAAPTERADVEQRIRSIELRVSRERALETERQREHERERAADRQRETTAPPTGGTSVAGWVLVSGGGALVGLGVAFGLVALGARGNVDGFCRPVEGRTICSAAASDALARDDLFSVLADVSVIVGVATAAVGVYLVVSSPSRSEPERRRLRVGLRARGPGAEVRVALDL